MVCIPNYSSFKIFINIYLFIHQAASMTETMRMDLLRKHPALMARLFDIKQDCLWKNLLMGKSQPFGLITDYWRRVEVNQH